MSNSHENFNLAYFTQASAFMPIQALCFFKEHAAWPTLFDYNHLLNQSSPKILSASGIPIKVISQRKKTAVFEEGYEPRVYLRGELQTRDNNWHDFFNLMMWLTFPKTKAIINKWQYQKLKSRVHGTQRTHMENLLTQFDEGGMIVVSSNKELIDNLKNHQWLNLFWHNRDNLAKEMQFYLIGHALYEKMLNPYVGMSACALIFEVEAGFMEKNIAEQIALIDARCAHYIDNDSWHVNMKTLFSVPVLGIPGWYFASENEEFYHNEKYFRPGKS